jgi:hypothetical protein
MLAGALESYSRSPGRNYVSVFSKRK